MTVAFDIPVEIKSLNRLHRMHHFTLARLKRRHRQWALLRCIAALGPKQERRGSFRVTLCRMYPRKGKPFDSHDNLPGGFKYVADGIARYLGIDDGCGRIKWEYAQEKNDSITSWVKVTLEKIREDGK